jgi:hypothetical protein
MKPSQHCDSKGQGKQQSREVWTCNGQQLELSKTVHTVPLRTHPAPPPKYTFYSILHLPCTPNIIISPPRINPAGFLTQFSLPDSLNATKGQKQNHQSVACLHVYLLSPINPLCSTTPLLPPPSFLLPFPLLLSYLLVAIAITVAVAVLTALALLAAAADAAAVACCACACTS